jgi:hypothetical protein
MMKPMDRMMDMWGGDKDERVPYGPPTYPYPPPGGYGYTPAHQYTPAPAQVPQQAEPQAAPVERLPE